jgi:DNA-binding CsgD family transcriptional regulator
MRPRVDEVSPEKEPQMEAIMTRTSPTPARYAVPEPATQLALRYFECLPKPTLLLRPDGAIERSNAAARALLLERHCLRIAYGRVVGFAGKASEAFADAWTRTLSGRVSRVVVTMMAGGAQLWQVELTPMHADPDEAPGDWLVMATVLAPVRPERGIVALARIFGLTCAEERVLAHLAEDCTPAEISAALGVSLTTVRTHLQSLFQKTGARRQPELVRLALMASSS